MNRAKILAALEETFQTSVAPDVSYNGLQFEGKPEISKIVTGVDASATFLREAIKQKADFAIVHHGLFWKGREWKRIDRFSRDIVQLLCRGGINLYALHLPLDSHREFGNNHLLASALGLCEVVPFGDFLNQKIGVAGNLPEPLGVEAFLGLVGEKIGRVIHHLPFGGARVRSIGIVSGGGWDSISDPLVTEGKIDCLLTGEVVHQAVEPCRERGIHLVAAGHYSTEVFGVRAIGEALASRFGLQHTFLDLPSGL